MTFFASINGLRVLTANAHVPFGGRWYVDVELDDDVQLTGSVVVKLGALELRGAVLPSFSGSFQLGTHARIVGGGGGWSRYCSVKHFHNDAPIFVKMAHVLIATASNVGEVFDATGIAGNLGIDFVRQAGPASRIFGQVLGSVPWWVGYDGITRAGEREQVEVTAPYDLLEFDPRQKVATLALDDPGAVVVGSVLRSRLERPLLVRQLDVEVTEGALRVSAWGKELAA